jgi:hypothetical protein
MKGTAKWFMVVFGIVLWASCTQLTSFEMPEKDETVDLEEGEQVDVQPDDVRVDDVVVDDVPVETGCGNSIVEAGEDCDDGNDIPGDGCENDCTWTCTQNSDCRDEEICNGVETCNTTDHICVQGTAMADCDVCDTDPDVKICVGGECVDPTCGDNCVTAPDEFCEPPGEGNCNAECQIICTGNDDCPTDGEFCNGEEYCNTTEGVCARQNVPAEGEVCQADPRQICIGESCQDSICGDNFIDAGATPAEECDDGNTTPDDGCENDCTWTCEAAEDCDDGEDCNGAETCDTSHVCQAGTPLNEGDSCDDGVFCNGEDTCDASGGCTSHAGDPCTGGTECNDACNETDGNCFTASGTACGDSGDTACDNPDTCDGAGTCAPNYEPDTTSCDDTVFCNGADTCDGAGDCTHHAGDPCADALTCTSNETCVESTASCTFDINYGTCLIGGTCYDDGEDNPANDCLECDNDSIAPDNPTGWTNVPDGTICGTGSQTCTGGVCG